MRLLVWLALGLLVYFALRSKLSSSGHATSARQQQPEPGQAGAETMVSCDHCGVYIPASEAISQAGHNFCSDEHRLLHRDS